MRDIIFYKKVFGDSFNLVSPNEQEDVVKIIDVDHIYDYEQEILNFGGELTVPTMDLLDKQKIAYYSDPNGNIFALLETSNKDM